MILLFLLALMTVGKVIGVAPEPRPASLYYQELESALQNKKTELSRISTLGSGAALSVLRIAQWHDHLARTQQRKPNWKDKLGYFFMENEIMAYADRCYVLSPEDTPHLYATVELYAKTLGIPTPLVLMVDDRKLFDATAACCSATSGFIVLSRGLFEETSSQEFCGLLAHEMGYVVQRYQAKMTLYFTPVAIAAFALMVFGLKKVLVDSSRFSWLQILGALGMVTGYGFFSILYWCALSRKYEKAADITAGLIDPQNGRAMIQALERNQEETFESDFDVTQSLVSELSGLAQEEREAVMAKITKMKNASVKALGAGMYDLGAFGTHRSLKSRKEFFEQIA